jgi:hypothetical protein
MNRLRNNGKRSKTKKPIAPYRSGLEAYCAKRLQEEGIEFEYEQYSYTLHPSFKGNQRYFKSVPKKPDLVDATGKTILAITYKPDFVSYKNKFVIETKGYVRSDDFPLRWKMFMKYCLDNGMNDWALYIPKNSKQVETVIQDILHGLK